MLSTEPNHTIKINTTVNTFQNKYMSITFILYLNLHPKFCPQKERKKNLLKKLVLQKLVSTKKSSIYFVDKKEVEWRRKKLGGSPITTPIQTSDVTYHHPKSRSIGSTTTRSSLHCVVTHTYEQKNIDVGATKSALLAHLTRKKTRVCYCLPNCSNTSLIKENIKYKLNPTSNNTII